MKGFKRGIVMVVALGMAALSFMGCSSNSTKLESIKVTPVDPVIASEIHFTATGTFSDGMVLNYSSEVIWSSSSPSIATVGTTVGTTGYITIVTAGTGTTIITAREPYNNFTSSSLLTVVTPTIITITPENPVMTKGTSHPFDAIATYVWSGTTYTQSLMSSPSLTWHSSDTSIATVLRGIVSAVTTTNVNIIATDLRSGVSGTMPLTVMSSPLKSIAVNPSSWDTVYSTPTTSQWFTAIGTFGDLTTSETMTLTLSVNWTSSATGTVLVSNATSSKGYATAENIGTAHIIATDPITSITGSALVTVNTQT